MVSWTAAAVITPASMSWPLTTRFESSIQLAITSPVLLEDPVLSDDDDVLELLDDPEDDSSLDDPSLLDDDASPTSPPGEEHPIVESSHASRSRVEVDM